MVYFLDMITIQDGTGKIRATFPLSVNVLLTKEEKFLLLKRANTSWMNGFYNFPAGHVEEGESPKQSVVRELAEELGITVLIEDVVYQQTIFRSGQNDDMARIDLVFIVERWQGDPHVQEDTSDKTLWVDQDTFPENVVPTVMSILNSKVVYQERI